MNYRRLLESQWGSLIATLLIVVSVLVVVTIIKLCIKVMT